MPMTRAQIANARTPQELRDLYSAQPENAKKTVSQRERWISFITEARKRKQEKWRY